MASAMTSTGLDEFRRGVEHLPDAITNALRTAAKASADRMRADAKRRLLAQTHGTGKTAELIEVVEDVVNHQYRVISNSRSGTPANTVIWLEHGTKHAAARPYMRPSADAERDRYIRTSQEAAVRAVEGALK